MQSKGLKNNFTEETKELFTWNEECWVCPENGWDCLHHILGRVSNSPLNAAPIHNFKCHIGNGKLARFEVKKKLLKKTFKYLMTKEYVLTEKDKKFKKKNERYYI